MMQTIQLYSENSDFQFIETLRRNRTKRHRHRAFFVEGVRSIDAALEYGWTVRAFYYARDEKLSSWAQGVLSDSAAEVHYGLPGLLMAKLSRKNETSELLATLVMPEDTLERLPIRKNLLLLVVDRSSNPGNLGTIIRSGDALGAQGIVITGHSVDLYDPEVIAASAGSFFALPSLRLPSHNEVTPWLAELRERLPGLQVVGSSAGGAIPLTEYDFTRPTVLLIGNETKGLSHNYSELCDVLVKIPMADTSFASSLNVACATTVMLYEIGRQRFLSTGSVRE